MVWSPCRFGRSLTGGKALPINIHSCPSSFTARFYSNSAAAAPEDHPPPRGALSPGSEYAVTAHAPERGGLGGAPVRFTECDTRTRKEARVGGLKSVQRRGREQVVLQVKRYGLENCGIWVKATIYMEWL